MKFIRELKWDGSKFISPEGHQIHITCLEDTIFRVSVLRSGQWVFPRTWSIAWDQRDVPFEGNDKRSLKGFSTPPFSVRQEGSTIIFESQELAAHVDLSRARIDWVSQGEVLLKERASDAYGLAPSGSLWHAHQLSPKAAFYGLGEASGPLNRRGRRFEMKNIDAMGYDAEKSDPLYKHYPFLIHQEADKTIGLFYDNFSTSVFNLGQEIDNYHGPYFSYTAQGGDLDFYLILGPSLREVTQKFTRLTGRPCLPPEWSLGFSGSTMTYTDAPDAQNQLMGFLKKIDETQLPCRSFHLSSGYTSIGAKRYVFHWNKDKIPNPAQLVEDFKNKGLYFIPNIKPVLLTDHPQYHQLANEQLFIKDSQTQDPELSQFWDGRGSHLDFTRQQTVNWWQSEIKKKLVSLGIEAVWNDNNEFQVWDDEALTSQGWKMGLGRPIQTLLMAKASSEAVSFVVSRSGMPGMQRYVQTWSGDNTTDWKTLRFNLCMALNLSLSGMSNLGHDIGGFAGPRPTPELFLRWIQHGIFYPRFVIHSWKEEGVNEPWMYPELLPEIKKLFDLRERLIPYFRSLQMKAHEEYAPFLRPFLYDFPQDPEACGIDDQFMVGESLMVANVFEPQANTSRVYLPHCHEGWRDFWTNKLLLGGQWVDYPVDLFSWPLFLKGVVKI